jgi:hypothetical protein
MMLRVENHILASGLFELLLGSQVDEESQFMIVDSVCRGFDIGLDLQTRVAELAARSVQEGKLFGWLRLLRLYNCQKTCQISINPVTNALANIILTSHP